MFFRKYGLLFAWIIAILASLGSFFFGEILKLEPCLFCWYQRICIYPLVIILGIAFFRRDYNISIYVIPLSIIGALIALYQIFMEKILPPLSSAYCKACIIYNSSYPIFGINVYFPILSLIAFLAIPLLLIGVYKNK